ncbi:MAG: hypothetical protein IPM69_19990 [Ignavibacteria bacterium]|nr:hypothetical protein [Ignavibacteria bacterium]
MPDASVPTTVSLQTSDFGDVHFDSKHVLHLMRDYSEFPELHEFILVSRRSYCTLPMAIVRQKPHNRIPTFEPLVCRYGIFPTIRYDLDTSSIFVIVTLLDEQKE